MTKDLTYGVEVDFDIETLQDYSGNSNDGTATGTTLTTDQNNRLNRARACNGSSDYITVGSAGAFDSVSEGAIAFSFKADNLTNVGIPCAIVPETAVGNGYVLGLAVLTTGKIDMLQRNATTTVLNWATTNAEISAGEWYRVVYRVESGVGNSLYINGEQVSLTYASGNSSSDDFISDITVTTECWLGARRWNGSAEWFFDGDVGDMKIWNTPPSEDEIRQDYIDARHNYQGLFDGLVAGYDFKGDAKDFSGNGNDGTVTGASLTTDNLGIANSAYDFSSAAHVISYGQLIEDYDNDFAVVIMFNSDDAATSYEGMVGTQATSYFFGLDDTDHIYYQITTTGGSSSGAHTSTVPHGSWHTLILVKSSTDGVVLYYDGDSLLTNTSTAAKASMSYYTTKQTDIGNCRNSSGSLSFPFDGKLTRPLLIDRDITASDAKAIHDLLMSGYVYPLPQNRLSGVTQ